MATPNWPFPKRRVHYFEIHDQSWCPKFIHDYAVDALAFIWSFSRAYQGVAMVLRDAMTKCETYQIIDICSGAGGPTPLVLRTLNAGRASPQYKATLTDLYPFTAHWDQIAKASNGAISYASESCDALALPATLKGFRTMYLSFHHFKPEQAKGILRDAIRRRQGIAVFEIQGRNWRSLIDVFILLPLVSIGLAPFIAPFSLGRILCHMLFPIIPLVLLHDGMISCLRAYSKAECEELVQQIRTEEPDSGVADYSWEFKKLRCGLFGLVDLYAFVGIPRVPLLRRVANHD